MSDEEQISNEDILLVLGISGYGEMNAFFNAYLDTKNEIQALAKSCLTKVLLDKWKLGTDYPEKKKLIDDYHLSLIEQMMMNDALSGAFKQQEMVLEHNNPKYAKDKGKKDKTPINVDTMVTNLMKDELKL
jgi:hypothetical protein